MSRIFKGSFVLQLLLLIAFLGFGWQADQAMDKSGMGDVSEWRRLGLLAGTAFYGLIGLWLATVVVAALGGVFRSRWAQIAIGVPPLLLVAGWNISWLLQACITRASTRANFAPASPPQNWPGVASVMNTEVQVSFSFEGVSAKAISAENDDGTIDCIFSFEVNGKEFKLELYEVVEFEDLGHLMAAQSIFAEPNLSGGYTMGVSHGFSVDISFSDYKLNS